MVNREEHRVHCDADDDGGDDDAAAREYVTFSGVLS